MKNKAAIYFDNNATTKIDDLVLQDLIQSYQEPLNSSSNHFLGRVAQKKSNIAREQIKELLGASNYQVIFTSSATEANNMALRSFLGLKIITNNSEHPSILNSAKKEKALILAVKENGLIDEDKLEEELKKLGNPNFLFSVMLVNNETGLIQNVKNIAKIVHKYGGLIHSDLTQGVGKIKIDLEDLNIDLASISAHKVHGPQGVGALLVRNGLDIEASMQGGLQENGKRPGTTNISGICAFGKACQIAKTNLEKYENITNLRNYLEKSLQEIAGDDLVIFCQKENRIGNTSFFATKNLDNKTLMINLDLENIAISTGSACSSGVAKNSHILEAMNIDQDTAKCAVRISLSKENTKEEIDKFLQIWQKLYLKMK